MGRNRKEENMKRFIMGLIAVLCLRDGGNRGSRHAGQVQPA